MIGAEEGTRTPTPLRVHGPEPCASANSATSARESAQAGSLKQATALSLANAGGRVKFRRAVWLRSLWFSATKAPEMELYGTEKEAGVQMALLDVMGAPIPYLGTQARSVTDGTCPLRLSRDNRSVNPGVHAFCRGGESIHERSCHPG